VTSGGVPGIDSGHTGLRQVEASAMQTIDLICPECGEVNQVPLADLAVGHEIMCSHCAVSLVVSHYQESLNQPKLWRLESSDQFGEELR
jgi:hypothetical protein